RDLEFEEALRALEHLRTLDRREWIRFSEDHVLALAAPARVAAARRVAREAFGAADEAARWRLAGIDAWLGGATGPDAETLMKQLGRQTAVERPRLHIRLCGGQARRSLR